MIISQDHCDDPAALEAHRQLLLLCQQRGLGAWLLPGLNDLPEQCSLWSELANLPAGAVFFSMLYQRAATWILRRHGITDDHMPVVSLRESSQAGAWECALPQAGVEGSQLELIRIDQPVLPRWYPVIDRSRCVNCAACLEFCMFEVYSTNDASEIVVANPEKCKPGCPACSRICPDGAIMFPLYRKDPVIAGAASSGPAEPIAPPAPKSPVTQELDQLVNMMEQVMRRRK